jgi:hypothetical protein
MICNTTVDEILEDILDCAIERLVDMVGQIIDILNKVVERCYDLMDLSKVL